MLTHPLEKSQTSVTKLTLHLLGQSFEEAYDNTRWSQTNATNPPPVLRRWTGSGWRSPVAPRSQCCTTWSGGNDSPTCKIFQYSPVTDEILLVEDGPIWTEECCGATILLAHIKRLQRGERKLFMQMLTDLAISRCVCVDAGQVLLLPTIETSLRHWGQEWKFVFGCFEASYLL